MLPKGVVFVVFCFVLRIVMALGGAAADTASFAIVAGEFGTNIGTVTVRAPDQIPRGILRYISDGEVQRMQWILLGRKILAGPFWGLIKSIP